MATRSNIGYQDPDTKRYHHIYCHFDGYPSHHLPILKEHYNTLEKVKELVALGDISVLAKNVAPVGELVTSDWKGSRSIDKHTFDTPDKDTVVAYHRDRGESYADVSPQVDDKFVCPNGYSYFFIDGEWHYKKVDF